MELFLIIFVIFILIIAAVLLVVLYYLRKGYRFIKRMTNGEMTEEEFERLSKKNYRRKDFDDLDFDADYFKTTDKNQKQKKQKKNQQQTSSRTFRTADGITITDQRNSHREKKIFAQDEGEYVDFKES
jgi:biopolymer transport protein ExbB/TolQ